MHLFFTQSSFFHVSFNQLTFVQSLHNLYLLQQCVYIFLFKGNNNLELINPKIKKTDAIIADQILIGSSYVKGQVLIIKKTMKKTKPKFLFELIFILFINFVILHFLLDFKLIHSISLCVSTLLIHKTLHKTSIRFIPFLKKYWKV